jgi:hypothetical protein
MRAVQRREKKSCRWVWRKCNSGIDLQGHPKKTKKNIYLPAMHDKPMSSMYAREVENYAKK